MADTKGIDSPFKDCIVPKATGAPSGSVKTDGEDGMPKRSGHPNSPDIIVRVNLGE